MNADWAKGRNERSGGEGIFPRSYVSVNAVDEKSATGGAGYGNGNGVGNGVGEGGQGGGAGRGKLNEQGKKFGKKMGNAGEFCFLFWGRVGVGWCGVCGRVCWLTWFVSYLRGGGDDWVEFGE